MSEQRQFIDVGDGVRLATTLYLPTTEGPFATLVEALPYRDDDAAESQAPRYLRFADEGEFAVLRVELRGTGSSGGIAQDEYTDTERNDLRKVFEWIEAQPWSTGRVGMFGMSYSGSNSLHMAMEGTRQLGAVVATHATDDRYSDDVHYSGGVLRALDLIGYPLRMIALNALPPTPAVWGAGWETEWKRRIDGSEPWLLEWLRHPRPDQSWRRGSVRLGPSNDGYRRMKCPVLLISGWADGRRNNTFRTIHEMPGWHLIAGPWGSGDPATTRPGPNIDSDLEMMRFFDHYLRGGPPATARRGQVFIQRPTPPPTPERVTQEGHWIELDTWPAIEVKEDPRRARAEQDEIDETDVPGDVGIMAGGPQLDQRTDNARSITYDWLHKDEVLFVGNCELTLQARSSAPMGHISVKLCDIAPDGTSTLITRGMLDLAQRGIWPSDPFGIVDYELAARGQPVVPGEWMDLKLQFEATTWTLLAGHRLRLAIAGSDWPTCWPPKQPFTLGVRRKSIRLVMWTAKSFPPARDVFEPGRGPVDSHPQVSEWRYEHDVVHRESRVHTRRGDCEGSLGVSTEDPSRAWAKGRARFQRDFREAGVCSSEATLDVRSDDHWLHVDIAVRAEHDGRLIGERRWSERFAR